MYYGFDMGISDYLFTKYGRLTYIDIIMMALYLMLCLYVGFKNSGKIRNIRDYALGPEKISTAALIATLYATHVGAGATVGVIERMVEFGGLFVITCLLKPLSWFTGLFLYRNVEQFRGCITIGDIVARLYDNVGRNIINISIFIASIATIAAQTAALGSVLHFFLEIPLSVGIILGAGVLIIYSVMGGIRAVIVTDIFQFGLFYVIIPITCGVVLHKAGGLNAAIAAIPTDKWQFTWQNEDQMWIFFSGILYALLPQSEAPFLQRFLISMNKQQITKSMLISAALDFLLVCTLCVFALAIVSFTNKVSTNHENMLWHILDMELWSMVKGLFVIGLVAAIMSTADSYLNSAGVLVAKDIVGLYYNLSDRTSVIIAKVVTALIGILAVTMVFMTPRIMSLLWFAINFYFPITLIPIVSGFLGFRTNGRSFVASTILAILGVLLGILVQGKCDVLSSIFGMSGSVVGLFGFHHIQKIFGILNDVAKQEKLYWEQYYIVEAEKRNISVAEVETLLQEEYEKRALQEKQSKKSIFNKLIAMCKKIHYLRFHNLLAYSQKAVAQFGERYELFGLFSLFFCVYPILFIHTAPMLEGNHKLMWMAGIDIRLILGFCCLSIGLKHMWNEDILKMYMPLYFYLVLMITFPALSTYSYLVLPEDTGAIAGIILSIFAVPLFVNWLSFAIITNLGFVIGVLLYICFSWIIDYNSFSYSFINGAIIYILLSIAITFVLFFEQEKNNNKLYYMSHHDALTKLVNRHYLNNHLDKLIEDSHARNNPLSIVTLDIDHFKKVNDTYGHDVGDIVLQHLSKILSDSSRPLDICARLGGEEFVIVLPHTTLDEASYIAQRLREKIKVSEVVIEQTQNISLRYTVSIGVADLKPGYSQDMLMKVADNALYEAKRLGRDRVEVALLAVIATFPQTSSQAKAT